ncbi:MAG: hypothetical protein IKW30_09965 [Lachnospiraceae bacterium]|nr:hypothetical protein [Lachnospiraceae bacterium]
MFGFIKTLVVSIYYLMFLTMDQWMNVILVTTLVIGAMIGFQLAKRKICMGKAWAAICGLGIVVLYVLIVNLVLKNGGIETELNGGMLRWIFYPIAIVLITLVANRIGIYWFNSDVEEEENTVYFEKIKKIIYIVGICSLIPLIMISPYVFAWADDYGFGYHCRHAWEDSGSLISILKAVFIMIKEAYFDWQGTYSSIFMMSIHPAVFNERLYAIVPMFFVFIIAGSSYFFLKTVLHDGLKIKNTDSKICIWTYILLGIQTVPTIQSAFFWYNGAVHYIASHCMQLCMMAFILRLYMGKRRWTDYLGCLVTAIYVGGGNLITLVGTLFLTLTIVLAVFVTKNWKQYRGIVVMCVVYWIAMAINLLAPGNYSRLGNANGMGLIQALLQAFVYSVQYLFGKWMDWTVVATILFLLPFLWRLVREIKGSFSYPVIVLIFSWCYYASLFFSPLYAAGMVAAGRYENVMYIQGLLLLFFNIAYLLGWIQRKYNVTSKKSIVKNEKLYFKMVAFSMGIGLTLSFLAAPTNYLTLGCIETLANKEALEEYAQDYWENVDLFTSGQDNLTVNSLSNIPQFLKAEESEAWHSGVRAFYRFQGLEFK